MKFLATGLIVVINEDRKSQEVLKHLSLLHSHPQNHWVGGGW